MTKQFFNYFIKVYRQSFKALLPEKLDGVLYSIIFHGQCINYISGYNGQASGKCFEGEEGKRERIISKWENQWNGKSLTYMSHMVAGTCSTSTISWEMWSKLSSLTYKYCLVKST